MTILQKRDRLRIYYEGEDLTPRFLVNPLYSSLEDKRTAFDVISLAQLENSRSTSVNHVRTSYVISSPLFSSIYSLDEIIDAKCNDSIISFTKESNKASIKTFDVIEDTEDVPSQFHLPQLDSQAITSPMDRVTIVLKETETFFIFELPQLTADTTSTEGQLVAEENERYKQVLATSKRKTMNTETQTPQIYTKTRGTCVGRQERKNHATIVNNWIMFDTLQNKNSNTEKLYKENRFKFDEPKPKEQCRDPDDELGIIASKDSYEEASRIILHILANKYYGKEQKRFVGLLRQDPCDPDLELVYGLELLWQHTRDDLCTRRVSAITWNSINNSLLAVGYMSPTKLRHCQEEMAPGIVIIWCAKNPAEPDRYYEFSSPVTDLDWSRTRPNLLAIGFYDGIVRIIDVSKKQLTIIRQSDRKSVSSYEPHWQVTWWPITSESFEIASDGEQLYVCNQDGCIYNFIPDEHFIGRQLLRLWRTEGKVPGIQQLDQCLSHKVSIAQSTAVLLLRCHPSQPGIYFVGTEEGYVHRCSTSHHQSQLETFRAHNGPIHGLEFSPFCEKILLTCGADWTARIWTEGLNEPLLTFSTSMACVTSVSWSPRNSTIFASAVNNEICIWDIRRKTCRPASVTCISQGAIIQKIQFTSNGEQIVAADDNGIVYVYNTMGIPLAPFDQVQTFINAIDKALLIKPEILKRFKNLGFINVLE
ncbi:PREDICTED: WD repeat-containing protein 78-like [Ceratosolen solmsi marchali]|uniref:Dynein axonemal intermediate chain 4 n=1 Tax=Ceratosolen solmsi marchali TaxID=326594 RepID=A0AAJ6YRT8_9HYME|nr:PREDICTED: WD repeat-containing protein 78-like [Ceratosolen solmsi marchali]